MRILIDGPLVSLNSASLINRQLFSGLLSRGYDLFAAPTKGNEAALNNEREEEFAFMKGRIKDVGDADITIRNSWPPDLTRPASGLWVVIQPWEFGSLPKIWVDAFSKSVDEMWVPSNYVREVYIKSGCPSDRVWVVPNGIDPEVFQPGAVPFKLTTNKRFKFLFVGGAIPRKGIDILLQAYSSTFTSSDDVCLVIKDFGADTFYREMTFRDRILDYAKTPGTPAIEYIDSVLSDRELAGLYVACDALVHPYRGEGFGLPILESMACGTPPIVTGAGPALDFCDSKTGILIHAQQRTLDKKQVFGMETVDFPSMFRVDIFDLMKKMKWAVNNPDELKILGIAAADGARANWSWQRGVDAAEIRIRKLLSNAPPGIHSSQSPPARVPITP